MNAREKAYKLLYCQLVDGQYINLGLKDAPLNDRDRSFVTRLVYDSLQQYDLMKYQYERYLQKKVPIEGEIILVMACVQHFLMDGIEDYAIVNESVNLTKKIKPGLSGLVNAVMKKVVKNKLDIPEDMSIATSHPAWMVRLFEKQLGSEKAHKLLMHNNTIPPLYVRLNKEFDISHYPIEKVEGYYISSGDIFKTDALSSGKIVIQDKASQQVVEFFDELQGDILDACGAPGTKTSQLAKRFNDSQIVLLDLHDHRVELAQDLMKRLDIHNVSFKVGDATTFQEGLYDGILCDVPCSGLGVLRRKPDLKRRIQPEDLDSLEALQASILDNMVSLLKENGQLVYSTCTLNKKENEQQIFKFLERHPTMSLLKEKTIEPWVHNSDGFYMALLVKKPTNFMI